MRRRPAVPRGDPSRARRSLSPGTEATPVSAHPPALLVLLAEDNDDNRAMYRQYLEWDGFRIVEATDGLQALGRAAALTLAAIVMDLSLPRLDGWEAVRRLKADPGTKHIPVLALTAHALVGDAEKAMAAGCDGYLTKPCLPEDLARAIRSLMRDRRRWPSRSARSVRSRPDAVAGQRSGQVPPSASGARQARSA